MAHQQDALWLLVIANETSAPVSFWCNWNCRALDQRTWTQPSNIVCNLGPEYLPPYLRICRRRAVLRDSLAYELDNVPLGDEVAVRGMIDRLQVQHPSPYRVLMSILSDLYPLHHDT